MIRVPEALIETPIPILFRGPRAMDALSDVLRVMRLKGGVFLRGEFSEPWCISSKVEPQSCAAFLGATAHIIPYHFVIEGRMSVRLPDGGVLDVSPGESIMFPHNDLHVMGSDLELQPIDSLELVQQSASGGLSSINLGENGKKTKIICGFLGAEDIRGNPVVSALPTALRLPGLDGSRGAWVRLTFHHAAEQIANGHLGSEALMGKVSELLFLEAIQRYAESLPDGHSSWLGALRDPYVSRAMALLHKRVGDCWTMGALAKEVGLSRSALAERFCKLIGMPPMQYLASWRIHVAAHELVNSHKSILQVAQEVGYESEASFTRAFKRLMSAPPATWRRSRI